MTAGLPLRRSPVHARVVVPGALLELLNGGVIALDLGDAVGEAACARDLGLADLSLLPRIGFKGWRTPEWLAGHQLQFDDAPNRAYLQSDGSMLARLSAGEFWLLGGVDGDANRIAALEAAWSFDDAPGTFPVPRADSHAWFALTGRHTVALLAKICGVDLRPHRFAQGAIAQTSVARLSAIVIRNDLAAYPAFFLLCDSAAAHYLWDCLLDAMAEFGGSPVGLSAVRSLAEG